MIFIMRNMQVRILYKKLLCMTVLLSNFSHPKSHQLSQYVIFSLQCNYFCYKKMYETKFLICTIVFD